MFRSAFLILSGNAAAALLLLLRNLIVARMIPVADYGVAATFALVMAVVEMVSALGLQQQIVQASEGDDPRFQAALQGFQVLRGVVAGAILFGIAGPTARFMGIPDVIWAYQILALVPVLNAAQHFDIHRLNRRMVFWPLLVSGAMPALISLVAALPLVWWLGDWRVMLHSPYGRRVHDPWALAVAARLRERWGIDPAVVASDAEEGRIEAVATSRLFGFADEVSIRIVPEGSGSRVDMRSRSRLGKIDRGTNAQRIRSWLADLKQSITAR